MEKTYLRSAQLSDMDLLYDWANDEETRKNSFSPNYISYDEHKKWFINKLNSKYTYQYIYYLNDVPIGQIRLDIEADSAIIDYSICKDSRGQGHGKNMLLLVEDIVKRNFLFIKRLTARVKEDNIPSKRAIESLKYEKQFTEYFKDID